MGLGVRKGSLTVASPAFLPVSRFELMAELEAVRVLEQEVAQQCKSGSPLTDCLTMTACILTRLKSVRCI